MKFGTSATLCAIAFLAGSVIAHAGDEPFGPSDSPLTTSFRATAAGKDSQFPVPLTAALSPASQLLVVLDKQQVRVIAPNKRPKAFSNGQIPDGAILVSCDEVQFLPTTEIGEEPVEPAAPEESRNLRFSGNVMLQTATFHGRADTVAYKGDWLTLSGNAQLEMGKKENASVNFANDASKKYTARGFKLSAESIRFHSHSRRMEINNDIDLEHLPSTSLQPTPDSKFE